MLSFMSRLPGGGALGKMKRWSAWVLGVLGGPPPDFLRKPSLLSLTRRGCSAIAAGAVDPKCGSTGSFAVASTPVAVEGCPFLGVCTPRRRGLARGHASLVGCSASARPGICHLEALRTSLRVSRSVSSASSSKQSSRSALSSGGRSWTPAPRLLMELRRLLLLAELRPLVLLPAVWRLLAELRQLAPPSAVCRLLPKCMKLAELSAVCRLLRLPIAVVVWEKLATSMEAADSF
mmetsp:Transcript_81315/g.242325  ORF Transcript_81315/g.242325 Transcript_81315/m.242325 type:complete len:234 (+) Transcript_81315:463-1164(+)